MKKLTRTSILIACITAVVAVLLLQSYTGIIIGVLAGVMYFNNARLFVKGRDNQEKYKDTLRNHTDE